MKAAHRGQYSEKLRRLSAPQCAAFAVLLLIAVSVLPTYAGRYVAPSETFTSAAQVNVITTEIEQGQFADAAQRLDSISRDLGDQLMPTADGGLRSAEQWVADKLTANEEKLREDYRKALDPAARQMLQQVRQGATVYPEDYYEVARRYPLASTAAEALTAAGECAIAIGDLPGAATYYRLAQAKGWKPDATHAAAINALVYWESGMDGVALHGLRAKADTGDAKKNAADMSNQWVGQAASEFGWYDAIDGLLLPKYLPATAGGVIYAASSRAVVAVTTGGAVQWTWASGKTAAATGDGQPESGWRGTVYAPALLTDQTGTARMVVVRQPDATGQFMVIRAFRASDGKLLWSTESDEGLRDVSFIGDPVAVGRYTYSVAIDSQADSATLEMTALETTSGRLLWRTAMGTLSLSAGKRPRRGGPAGGDADAGAYWQQSAPAVYEDALYVTPNCGEVIALDRFDGRVRWIRPYESNPGDPNVWQRFVGELKGGHARNAPAPSSQLRRWQNTPVVIKNTIVAAPQDTGAMFGIERTSGQIKWNLDYRNAPAAMLVGASDGMAICCGTTVVGVLPETGQTGWTYMMPTTSMRGPAVVSGGVVGVPTGVGVSYLAGATGGAFQPMPTMPDVRRLVKIDAVRRAFDEAELTRWFSASKSEK